VAKKVRDKEKLLLVLVVVTENNLRVERFMLAVERLTLLRMCTEG